MSDFDSNPFADPDFSNPFQVTLASWLAKVATLALAAALFNINNM